MKHSLTKLLCLLLCAVMVLGLIPPVSVSAAENEGNPDPNFVMTEDGWDYYKVEETEEAEIPVVEETDEPEVVNALTKAEDVDYSYEFENLEDLKQGLALPFPEGSSWMMLNYAGTEPLVITENIIIPAYFDVYVWSAPLVVAEGATLTIGENSYLGVDDLTINGTLNCEGNFHVAEKLTVNGVCEANYLNVNPNTEIVGFEKISFPNSWNYMTITTHDIKTADELYKAVEELTPRLGGHVRAYISIWLDAEDEDLVLTKSLTIPTGMQFAFEGEKNLIIDTDCTMTLQEESYFWAHSKVVVKGTLNLANTARMDVSDARGYLEVAGGKIPGKGEIRFYCQEGQAPTEMFSGIEMTNFELNEEWDNVYVLKNTEGLTKLANPAPAQWGIRYDYKWNAAKKDYDINELKIPCSFAVKGVKDAVSVRIEIYMEKDGDDELIDWYEYGLGEEDNASFDIFQDMSRPSGNYYVTVQAIGDYETTRSSDVVTSEKFAYTNPGKYLDKVTNVKVENGVFSWDAHPNKTYADGYLVYIYASETADGEAEEIVYARSTDNTSLKLPQYVIDMCGDAYYSISVSCYSKDATKFLSSEPVMSNRFQAAPVEALRYAGKDRFETSFLVADALLNYSGSEQFSSVVIASGANFADALAGSYLATWYGAPILLSYKEKQNNQVKDYIKENLIEGGRIFILGGESAVPKSMETGLENYEIVRLAGKDRFETNLEILKKVGVFGYQDILVSTGTNFADSLSASAVGMPILLVYKKLTDNQKDFLTKNADPKTNNIVILGGENAVSAAIEAEFKALGFNVRRLAGKDRFETSVMVAKTYFDNPTNAVLAYAGNYPDGLCGSTLAMYMNAPLILTMDKFASVAADYVKAAGIERTVTLGGTGLISDGAVSTILGK